MALRLSDVPTGYKVTSAGYLSLASAARENRVPRSTLEKRRYVVGYEIAFEPGGGLSKLSTRPAQIVSLVTIYRAKRGAIQSLGASVASCSRVGSELPLDRKFGDESHLCKVTTRTPGKPTTQSYLLMWRRGDLRATIIVGGVSGSGSSSDAVSLGEKQDRRMR
jgi:hypothetical protein